MASIFGWQADYAGCAYYRVTLPLTELARRGHRTTATGTALGRYAELLEEADVLLGQRVADPGPSALWQCLALAGRPEQRPVVQRRIRPDWELLPVWQRAVSRQRRQRLVFEIDDDLFAIDRSNPGHTHYSRPEVRAALAANAALADLVVVSTEPLAEVLRAHNPNVAVVPNTVPADLLAHTPPRREDGVITVGWAGSPTHAMDWAVFDDELVRFLRKARRAELHVIGGLDERWTRVPAHRRRVTPWFPSVPEFHRAIDFHIGLAPLRPHPFNTSKSAVKALEYAALGIPVVASDVGPYREFVRHGETGFLVRHPGEWVRYLMDLVHDADLRAGMGAAARRLAAEHTVEANGHLWESALLGVSSPQAGVAR